MDADAPLPELARDAARLAAAAAAARELGLNALARRIAERGVMEVDQPSRLHAAAPDRGPPGVAGADRGAARAVPVPSSARRPPRTTSCAATRPRCSTGFARRRGWLDVDTICTATSFEAALLAAGAAIEAARAAGFALARPPGHHAEPGARDGLLHLRLDRDRGALGAGRARAGARRDPRLGRPPRQRDAGDRRRRPVDLLRLAAPVAVLSGTRRARRTGRDAAQPPAAAGTGDDAYLAAFERAERAVAAFEPELLLVSAGFDAHVDDPLASSSSRPALFEELAPARRALAPRVAAVLEGGYNLATLPDLVESALRGFRTAPGAGTSR